MRILVVEDNPKLSAGVARGLRAEGYAVDTVADGFEAEELIWSEPYEAVILDMMLPGQDGLQICRNLRRRKVETPIVMLTSLSDTAEKVNALDAGADDYLTKPFAFDELLARLRAVIRRGSGKAQTTYSVSDLTLDTDRRVAVRDQQVIQLSSREYALLLFFFQNLDKVLSRTSIIEKVWDMNYEPESNVVDVYVSSLRKKIDRNFDPPLLHTVIGQGYRFGLPLEDTMQNAPEAEAQNT
jgi:DNA-binding response OmpR family regulator